MDTIERLRSMTALSHVGLVAIVLGVVAGCRAPAQFVCHQSAQCIRGPRLGVCEPTGFCSFADVSCPSGSRYDSSAGADANLCVTQLAPPDASSMLGDLSGSSADLQAPAGADLGPASSMDLASASSDLSGALLTLVRMARPATLDLTDEGTMDWSMWDNTSFVHKSNPGNITIGNYTKVGNGVFFGTNDEPTTVSWSDGTPVASQSNDNDGGDIAGGTGKGYGLSVGAEAVVHVLRLYVQATTSPASLHLHLSDASADDAQDTLAGDTTALYQVTYRAASTAQSLSIQFLMQGAEGNVDLQAATLQ